ncbi:hypothetical protein BDQ17DRAFT_1321485 [Cyathus striatus]|nr:hypothetical protein BDQ17DRAFT_1321485 [Cyathus striatus]
MPGYHGCSRTVLHDETYTQPDESDFEALEEQAQKMVCVSADIQASDQASLLFLRLFAAYPFYTLQLKQLHDELEQQIARQHAEMQRVRLLLEDKVKEALEHRLKAQAYEMIKNTISQQIGHKIRSEMSCQIPSKLSHTSKARRPVLEIKTNFDKKYASRPIH